MKEFINENIIKKEFVKEGFINENIIERRVY